MRIAHVAPSAGRVASGVLTAVEAAGHRAASGEDTRSSCGTSGTGRPGLEQLRTALRGCGCPVPSAGSSARARRALPVGDIPEPSRVDWCTCTACSCPLHTAVARAWRGPAVLSPHGGYDPVSLRRSVRAQAGVLCAASSGGGPPCATTVASHPGRGRAGARLRRVRSRYGSDPRTASRRGQRSREGGWLRSAFGVSPDARLALFVGRLDVRHKGLDRLVQATAAAPDWQVAARRARPSRRRPPAAAESRLRPATAGRVHLVGSARAAELADVHAAADVFVLPSRWEGLPMSLLEATGAGRPGAGQPGGRPAGSGERRGAGWVARRRKPRRARCDALTALRRRVGRSARGRRARSWPATTTGTGWPRRSSGLPGCPAAVGRQPRGGRRRGSRCGDDHGGGSGRALPDQPGRLARLSAACMARGQRRGGGGRRLVAVVHLDDRYAIDHASGARIALARYAARGALPVPWSARTASAGRASCPCRCCCTPALSRLTGEYLVSGKLLDARGDGRGRSRDVPGAARRRLPAAAVGGPGRRRADHADRVAGGDGPAWRQPPAAAAAARARRRELGSSSRRATWLAAALAALAVTAKLHALWAPAAILALALDRHRRRARGLPRRVRGDHRALLGT